MLKRKVLLLGMLFASVLLVFGCSEGQSGLAPSPESSASRQNVTSKEIWSIGEEIIFDNGTLVVTQVERSAGNVEETPEAGDEFVIVTVRLTNTGKDLLDYGTLGFTMQNGAGEVTEPASSMVDVDTHLNGGTLAPGETVEGTVVFVQPIGSSDLVLRYKLPQKGDETVEIQVA